MKFTIIATTFAALASAAPTSAPAPAALEARGQENEKFCIFDGALRQNWLEWGSRRFRYEGYFVSDGGDPAQHAERFMHHWTNSEGHRDGHTPKCWHDQKDRRHFWCDISVDPFGAMVYVGTYIKETMDTFNELKGSGASSCRMNTE